jgi:hypothetical protein
MAALRHLKDGPTRKVWAVADLLLVAMLGVIDYMTGDYSILIFYIIPVALGSWFSGVRFGLSVAIISGAARLYADYQTYVNFSSVRYLNIVGDVLFLLMVALIASIVRKMLGKNHAPG